MPASLPDECAFCAYEPGRPEIIFKPPQVDPSVQTVLQHTAELLCVEQDGVLVFVNQRLLSSLGYEASEILGMPFSTLVITLDPAEILPTQPKGVPGHTSEVSREIRILLKDGSFLGMDLQSVSLDWYGRPARLHSFTNQLERVHGKAYRELSRDVLQILNEPGDLFGVLEHVLILLQERLGLDAVGIRLQHGEDFPYYVQRGFSPEFLQTENSLHPCGVPEHLRQTALEGTRLECLCGLVISGQTPTGDPHFSSGGSFWTNDSASLLLVEPELDPRFRPRNVCIRTGYASLAVVPIRNQARVIGLLQCNDRRKGRFSWADIERLESIAAHIGTTLMRKQAEEALRESEERYRAVSEFSHNALCILDPQGKCIWTNARMVEITGFTSEQLREADSFLAFLTPESKALLSSRLHQCLSGQKYEHHAWLQFLRSDGQKRTLEKYLTDFVDTQGRHLCILSLMDVTDVQLIETRLRQAEKVEALGQLAGGIAHDFNNILGGIIGYTEMSAMLVGAESVLGRNLQQILKASHRAKQLVWQILTFSRQSTQEKSILPVCPLIEEVLELLKASIPSTVQIRAELNPRTKPIFAESTKIHELILNLATNAVYAMKRKGTLTLRLYSTWVEEGVYGHIEKTIPGEYVVIEVGDTGCGMDAETLRKIFDPFFTTKPVGEGTGMGLSVVLGVAQLHGGDVQVESMVGAGTTFKVFLPVAHGKESLRAEVITTACPGGSERIVFVDDETMLLQMAQTALGGLGYQVVAFSDSLDALQWMEENSDGMDMLISDQTMPMLTGLELAKEVLRLRPELPIILCTGYSTEINHELVSALGIRRLAMKPLHLSEFMHIVRDELDRKTQY